MKDKSTAVSAQLIVTNGFWRPEQKPDGAIVLRNDESRIPIVLEACLATGVSRVAIPAWSGLAVEVPGLAPDLQRLVVLVDEDGRAFRKLHSFLAPVREEFGIDYSVDFCVPVMIGTPRLASLHGALFHTFVYLLDFFLGIEHGLQVSTDPRQMIHVIKDVLAQSRDPSSRVRLSFLVGVLQTYRRTEIDGLRGHASNQATHVQQFLELLEDSTYRDLSRQAHLWGIPEHSKRALTHFQRFAKRLLTDSPIARSLRLGRQVVTTTTGISLPDDDSLGALLASGYVPAMVDMAPVWKHAQSSLRGSAKRGRR
jgi:hypothetical protein